MDNEKFRKKLFGEQLRVRRLLHEACDLADGGEALLGLDPKPMTERQWSRLARLVERIRDRVAPVDGAIQIGRMFSRKELSPAEKRNLDGLVES